MAIWWRGGAVPRDRPVWLAASREYAAFYGEDVSKCEVRGKILDLTSLGVDVDHAALASYVDRPISTSSDEMYEWAENAARQLHDSGYSGVAVMQWNAKFDDEPQRTALIFDSGDVVCKRSRRRNPPRYRYLATSDEGDACHCCGRTNLKRYVWLAELDEDGNALGDGDPYGTTCAAHLLRGSCGKKPSVGEAKKIIDVAADEEKARLRREFDRNYEQASDALRHLRPPAAIRERNEYGVPLVRVGDAAASYGSRWDTDEQNARAYDLDDATRRAQRDWLHNRVLEWMEERTMRTAPFGQPRGKNPADDDEFDDEDDSDAPASYRDFNAWIRALKQRKREFIAEHREIFERDGIVVVPGFDGRYSLALTRGTTSPFRVTSFLGDEPVGHGERDTLDDALTLLWEDATSEYKRAPKMPPSQYKRAPKANPRARALSRRVVAL